MEEITKLIDSLPSPVKIFVGAMLGMQVLAFTAWIVMMLREGSNKEDKEKQS